MHQNKLHVNRYFSQLLLLAILMLLIITISSQSPYFFAWKNWRNILDTISVQILLALGMNFIIASGGIDLSQGAIISLSGIIMALCLKSGLTVPAAICLGIIAAVLMGVLNGLIIFNINVNPFIVTLGTSSLYRGAAIIITGGKPIYTFPPEFTFWGKGGATQLNPPIFIACIMIGVAVLIMHRSKWGQYALAMGGNEAALRRAGINVGSYKTSFYSASALMAGLVALILTARLNTAEPNAGMLMEIDAITAVIMGGSLMRGGKANISGTIIACLLLGVIKNGLTIMSISSYYQQFIIGFLLLTSVILTELRQRKQIKF